MSLQVWLPLNGDLNNQGLSNITFTNNNATIGISGKVGQCYEFNGTSARISSPSVIFTYPISFAAWVNFTNAADTTTEYVCSYNTATDGTTGHNIGFGLYQGKLTVWHDGTTWSYTTVLNSNQWYHIAVVVGQGYFQVFLDGASLVRQTKTDSDKSSRWITIGARSNSATGGAGAASYFFKGKLNDVRFYDHALSAKEVSEIAKGLMIHYKLDNNGFGQPNLAFDTYGVFVSGLGSAAGSRAEYRTKSLGQSLPVTSGSKVTVSFDVHMVFNTARAANTRKLLVYNSNNKGPHYGWTSKDIWYSESIAAGTVRDEHISYSTTVNSKSDSTLTVDWIEFYSEYGTSNWYSISNLHIEPGEVETPWAPNAQDAMAAMLVPTIEDDCSGYRYNADKTNITVNGSTPRYSTSSTFNGSSSYIKVPTNAWMVNGATEMTISIWAKATAWSSWNSRLYSCTESGGFNCEWYSTNSTLSFTQNVYTNAAQSTHGYPAYTSRPQILRSDLTEGWHLFTYTYTTSTSKIYLDGVLYQECPYTSYGLYFNKNINLFLGCEAGSSNNASSPWYSGQFSDFRLYATALSAAAIKELYETSASIDKNGNVYAREVKEI